MTIDKPRGYNLQTLERTGIRTWRAHYYGELDEMRIEIGARWAQAPAGKTGI